MKNESGKFDYSISLIRGMAMVFIVLAHMSGYINFFAWMAQFFNVGVPIFFLISGFLYGKKHIKDWKRFFFERLSVLLIPVYIILIVFYSLTQVFCIYNVSLEDVAIYVLNLQGGGFVLDVFLPQKRLPGLDHLWFLTVLMMCYVLVLPLLQMLRSQQRIWKWRWVIWGVGMILSTITPFFAGIHIQYFLVFSLGYFLSHEGGIFRIGLVCFWILLAAVACVLRLYGKVKYDGTYMYDQVIVVITHICLAFAFFAAIKSLFEHSKYTQQIADITRLKKSIMYIDRLSYYIYLTHYSFLTGIFALTLTGSPYDELLYVITMSVLSAIGLKVVSDRMRSILKRDNNFS